MNTYVKQNLQRTVGHVQSEVLLVTWTTQCGVTTYPAPWQSKDLEIWGDFSQYVTDRSNLVLCFCVCLVFSRCLLVFVGFF